MLCSITVIIFVAFIVPADAKELGANHTGGAEDSIDNMDSMHKLSDKSTDTLADNAQDSMDKLVDKLFNNLFDRAVEASHIHHQKLDRTTLGKLGHLATPPRRSLRPIVPVRTHQHTIPGHFALPWAASQPQVQRGATSSRNSRARAASTIADVEAEPLAEIPSSSYLPFKGVNPKLVPKKRVELNNGKDTSDISTNMELSPEELIELTKQFLNTFDVFGTGKEDPEAPTVYDLLADDFQFIAPVVGPLPKDEFLSAFSSFKLADAFPDGNPNYYNFHVDPFKPNRVFYVSHFVGTNTGSIAGVLPATNKRVESPPQAQSVTFNSRGEITMFTIGYVMDKNIGNTGGLGGAYGIFYAIGYGLPFPESQPWQPSPPYFLATRGGTLISGLASQIRKSLR